ncbi:MAG: glycosyltransferase [Gloeobacteraceae cyanobacterium ES-bin-316]|nr:glycosyltransferase [Ferruginibacter sp.]
MIRICTSLANAGYQITLVGRKKQHSIALKRQPFKQKRLPCFFETGKLFYAEYNLRLFFYLLFRKMDAVCAIDLDTILPCYFVSKIKNIKRIYDAHELFCEMKEIVSRPYIYKVWKWIEQKTIPFFKYGYSVNTLIAAEFLKMYGSQYDVIRSIALYDETQQTEAKEKFILYQGAVNEGRSFETLLPAMQQVDGILIICGDGNFMQQAKALVQQLNLQHKVIFKGMLEPATLRSITNRAYIGVTLFEKDALSNYYSLANRFFDYIHSAVPQVCVNYPVYREINNLREIAVLIDDVETDSIAIALNGLINDEISWRQLHQNCKLAAKDLNWQKEEEKLIAFYKKILG